MHPIIVYFSASFTLTFLTQAPIPSLLILIAWQAIIMADHSREAFVSFLSGAILAATLLNRKGKDDEKRSYFEVVPYAFVSTYLLYAILVNQSQFVSRFFVPFCAIIDLVYFGCKSDSLWFQKQTVMFGLEIFTVLNPDMKDDKIALVAVFPIFFSICYGVVTWYNDARKKEIV